MFGTYLYDGSYENCIGCAFVNQGSSFEQTYASYDVKKLQSGFYK